MLNRLLKSSCLTLIAHCDVQTVFPSMVSETKRVDRFIVIENIHIDVRPELLNVAFDLQKNHHILEFDQENVQTD